MFKRLFSLFVAFMIGWVIYVQFFGTDEQLALRSKLFSGVKETGQTVMTIISSEGDKLKEGGYHEALDKLAAAIDQLRGEARKSSNGAYLSQINELEVEKEKLEKQLASLEQQSAPEKRSPGQGFIAVQRKTKPINPKDVDADFISLSEKLNRLADKMSKDDTQP